MTKPNLPQENLMPTPSAEIIQVISVFAVAFSTPTFAKVLTLLPGVILSLGRRTVTAALRMVGLADDKNFSKATSRS